MVKSYLNLFIRLKTINNNYYPEQLIYFFIFKLNKDGINSLDVFIINNNNICSNYKYIVSQFKYIITNNIPIERFLKLVNFYGYEYFLDDKVFCPKSDTSILVYQTIQTINKYNNNNKIKIVELGSGSGAIICSISLETKNKYKYYCYENNLESYNNTIKNINHYQLNIKAFNEDYLLLLTNNNLSNYDIYVVNPPYIDINDLNVDLTTKKYEPDYALYAKLNGFKYYFEIINYFIKYKYTNKIILFEIGINQDQVLKNYLISKKINNFEFYSDINNVNRVLKIIF